MYKIMLAEDEPEVLDSMILNIDWGKYGFSAPVGCRDGAEALQYIEGGFVPDAIITDIRMPMIDGLQLSLIVREKLPKTLIVILSGHDEFSYAQKALQLKAYDYVLKPITPISLQNLLQKLRAELDERNLNDMDSSIKIVENHFLNRLLNGEMDSVLIEENCKRHKLNFCGTHHAVALLDLDPAMPSDEAQSEKDINLLRYGTCNIAQEILEDNNNIIVFQGSDKKIRVLASGEGAALCETTLFSALELIKNSVGEYLNITVSAGIGGVVFGKGLLYLSAKQAAKMFDYRFFYGIGSLLQEKDIALKSEDKINFALIEEAFDNAIQNFEHGKAFDILDNLFKQMKSSYTPFETCLKYFQRLVVCLLNFTGSFTEHTEIETLELAWEQHSLYSAVFLGHMHQLMHQFLQQVFAVHSLICNDSASMQIIRAENYIRQNYNNPKLSLQMVTDYLSLSTSHFSAIYKAKTGCTFIESLTKIRMQKAKQILTHTDRRTYEVAEDVGFSDPHYFSAAFKRVTGTTPREHRERSRKKAGGI